MKIRTFFAIASTLMLLVTAVGTVPVMAAGSAYVRQISQAGTTTPAAAALAADSGFQDPELASTASGGDTADAGADSDQFHGINRSFSNPTTKNGRSVSAHKQAKSNPGLNLSMDGVNFRQQRLANGGNQFSVEPPDQGLCAGNGFVLESVNDVLRIFHADGSPATGVIDLNTFYGYPAAFNRSTGVIGPEVTDPTCIYDQTTGRFVHLILTLEVVPSGSARGRFTGPNHLDIAVSNTSDPTGAWTIYRLPVQDDGTAGTPNHHCSPAATPPPSFRTNPSACIGDYPHIGADANGIYLETNEYDFFGDAYHGSQIYAISNQQLAALPPSITVTQFDTATAAPGGKPGFTIWPAQTPGNQFSTAQGGTEYFLSSNAADEAQCDTEVVCTGTRTSSQLVLWALTNTSSLASGTPALSLSNKALNVDQYAVPARSNQKPGNFPLGQCFNDTACSTFLIGIPDPFAPEVEGPLDSNDTRMQQVMYANGRVWGALDTDILVNGVHQAGIEYFIVTPSVSTGSVTGHITLQGTLALDGNNVIYPAIGVTASGRGVMAFTVVGNDHYPSAGYASMDALVGAGDVHIAAEGAGPQDGFSEYKIEAPVPPFARPRWGDYGAAAVDGKNIWIASEYIGQTCTLAQYESAPFGSCGGTRASLGNWDTRISQVTP